MTRFETLTIIISAVSAFVTLVAVLVALRLGVIQWKKKIYLTFNNNLNLNIDNERKYCLEILIFNGGNAKVAITNIYLNKNKSFALPILHETQLFQKPEILDVSESISLIIVFEDFVKVLEHEIKRDKIKLDRNIKIAVEDISGKMFFIDVKNTPNEYLLWSKGGISLFPILSSDETDSLESEDEEVRKRRY